MRSVEVRDGKDKFLEEFVPGGCTLPLINLGDGFQGLLRKNVHVSQRQVLQNLQADKLLTALSRKKEHVESA